MVEFVAEFTTNHMGNLNVLLHMVEKAAQSGASYIKMQKKEVESFYDKEKLDSEFHSPYGHTYRDYRTIFEFNDEDYHRFDAKCKEYNIKWFTTVQDIPSLHWMLKYDLDMYKVASCNSNNIELLKEIEKNVPKDKRIVISVAGRSLKEIENAINIFPNHGLNILHCVAEYPCSYQNLRLGNIKKLIDNFSSKIIKIGYSGHEKGIIPSIAAIDLGAQMIERHFCLSRHSFVHHIECSLEPCEFEYLVNIVRNQKDLVSMWKKHLPDISLKSYFGMSDLEREFLEKNKYGRKYLIAKDRSSFKQ